MRRKILALVIVLSLASMAVIAQEANLLVTKDDTLVSVLKLPETHQPERA